MSKRKYENVNMILEENAYFKGTLNSPCSIKINGIFEGKIVSSQNVYIGPHAKINGDIEAQNITIDGKVTGNIIAKGKTHLTSTCQLEGQIITKSFIIDEGAYFLGNCRRTHVRKIS